MCAELTWPPRIHPSQVIEKFWLFQVKQCFQPFIYFLFRERGTRCLVTHQISIEAVKYSLLTPPVTKPNLSNMAFSRARVWYYGMLLFRLSITDWQD